MDNELPNEYSGTATVKAGFESRRVLLNCSRSSPS